MLYNTYFNKWCLVEELVKKKFYSEVVSDFCYLDIKLRKELTSFWLGNDPINQDDINGLSADYSCDYFALCLLLLIFKEKKHDDFLSMDSKLEDLADLLEMNPSLIYFKELEQCNSEFNFQAFVGEFSKKGKVLSQTSNSTLLNLLLNNDDIDLYSYTNERYELVQPLLIISSAETQMEEQVDVFNEPLILTEDDALTDDDSIEMARADQDGYSSVSETQSIVFPYDDLPSLNEDTLSSLVIKPDVSGLNLIVEYEKKESAIIADDESIDFNEKEEEEIFDTSKETVLLINRYNENGYIEEEAIIEPPVKDVIQLNEELEAFEMELFFEKQMDKDDCNKSDEGPPIWYNICFGNADHCEDEEDDEEEDVEEDSSDRGGISSDSDNDHNVHRPIKKSKYFK
ncbi:predicted protein [Naegleria gruberi]|uniref:Predicted protein n=1 Tax=Naegleria gruberi TaxID=5762 RepID=D2V8Z9_NAEGR|nr:uncharacterized protein NAEGRDRAFT_65339 [Naegleria gruberi]EFC46778.1 predicted protein [Naegleria gruberi]|eukprot:XP_002679522.1 predicted protein [Naegleria gruberi strain NEG-M]